MHHLSFLKIFQSILILVFISIPPWLTLNKYLKVRVNRFLLYALFFIYIAATIFTQNALPFFAVLISIYFLHRTGNSEEELFYFRPLKQKKLEVFLKSVGFKFIISIINIWFAFFLMGYGIKLQTQEISKIFIGSSWPVVILLVILTVVTAPIVEEFIFRHTLYRQLSKRIGRISACLITSALFALLHFNFLGTVSFFGVGIFNCYLYDKYGYRAAVFNHFLFNFTSTFMIIIFKLFHLPMQ